MRANQPAVAMPGGTPAPAPPRRGSRGLGALLAFLALAGILAFVAAAGARLPYAPAFLLPTALAAGLGIAAKPAVGAVGLFAITGFHGTLTAYTAVPTGFTTDFFLLALWAGAAWRSLSHRDRPTWLLPGMAILLVYIAVTMVGAFFATPLSHGLKSVHLSVWLMATALLIGLGPWRERLLWTIARGALVVGALVASYAILRTITGPTDAERELALAGKPGFLQLKTSGSLPTANHLASWCTALLPFALALALTLRDRWRYVAAATAAGTLFAVLATEVRVGIVAAAAGAALVFVTFALASAFPSGMRSTRLASVGFLAVLAAGVTYTTTIGTSSESTARFERILNPGEDFAYNHRVTRWEEAFEVIRDEPLGLGLGTVGSVATLEPFAPEITRRLDSSYMKVAVEQGLWVLLLFIVGLVVLLGNLAWRSIATPDPRSAALGIGAAGALLGAAVSFYANTYIEEPQILATWLLVGLGVAQFSHPPAGQRPTSPGRTSEWAPSAPYS